MAFFHNEWQVSISPHLGVLTTGWGLLTFKNHISQMVMNLATCHIPLESVWQGESNDDRPSPKQNHWSAFSKSSTSVELLGLLILWSFQWMQTRWILRVFKEQCWHQWQHHSISYKKIAMGHSMKWWTRMNEPQSIHWQVNYKNRRTKYYVAGNVVRRSVFIRKRGTKVRFHTETGTKRGNAFGTVVKRISSRTTHVSSLTCVFYFILFFIRFLIYFEDMLVTFSCF